MTEPEGRIDPWEDYSKATISAAARIFHRAVTIQLQRRRAATGDSAAAQWLEARGLERDNPHAKKS